MRLRLALATVALPIAVFTLAGCSSTSADSSASPAASAPGEGSAPASAPATPAPIGSGAMAPVTISIMEAAHDVTVGDTIVFEVTKLAGTTVDSDAPDVVAVTQASESDGVVYNPGGTALKVGKANITITDEQNKPHYIHIEVTE